MLDTVVMYGDDVCCSVVFGTLVGVFVFSVMWSECQRVECAYAVLYVRVSCFVVRGCGVSRRYIDVCYCDMFSVVNVYLYH